MIPDLAVQVVLPAAALAAGFLVGRLTGERAARVRDLEARIEDLAKQREQSAAELQAAKAEIENGRRRLDEYQTKVSEHFAGTSEQFRDFSLRYRALFDHLARGASDLCPDGFPALEGSPEAIAAGETPSAAEPPGDESDAASANPHKP